jgi:hypothetical protein
MEIEELFHDIQFDLTEIITSEKIIDIKKKIIFDNNGY